jgi:hypothetical protein
MKHLYRVALILVIITTSSLGVLYIKGLFYEQVHEVNAALVVLADIAVAGLLWAPILIFFKLKTSLTKSCIFGFSFGTLYLPIITFAVSFLGTGGIGDFAIWLRDFISIAPSLALTGAQWLIITIAYYHLSPATLKAH